MSSPLGKRKRPSTSKPSTSLAPSSPSSNSRPEPEQDAQAIFRRHFEAHFKPLPLPLVEKKTAAVTITEDIQEENAEGSDWDGISERDDGTIEVMEHHSIAQPISIMSREELRGFMTSKPPPPPLDTSPSSPKPPRRTTAADEDSTTEAAHLKKDLALQRLLAESHLLDPTNGTDLHGTNRHKALDLRVQSLGAKTSLFRQEKMPMAHRRGIVAKETSREEKRRREARENGVVLEKATTTIKSKSQQRKEGRRDRGVGAPGVGTFAGGMLRLSRRDVFAIEGPRRGSGGRSGRGGSRGRGGRTGRGRGAGSEVR